MNQALYAHMNNKRKMKKNNKIKQLKISHDLKSIARKEMVRM
jgi:hypothetical protein